MCPECGKSLHDVSSITANFCCHCGADIREFLIHCSKCNTGYNKLAFDLPVAFPYFDFCPNCAEPIKHLFKS